ncbi:hypothetical protein F0P96_17720 [Hymenobacter busanensis]|uniref:Uncharacterized protein n=1 Tax=Hymenobacter busanensis TaxID=2607656 RepID=A0A7L5A555_9BACT|nr:hypothetical protein [Hymenobacter busanensis]KAA9327078.1 hypothetical protein F0P96_17720 [Hymenobacter busanensis]QHJ09530.1 hypothetical protein GUY19_20540 [Hymenobacter busanensis]
MLRSVLAAALLLTLAGCSGKKDDFETCPDATGPAPAGYKVILRLRGGTNVQGVQSLNLITEDNEKYPCINYALQTTLTHKNNDLTLRVCGTTPAATCKPDTTGPANSSTSVLGLVGGRYNLVVNVRGRRTTGVLDLSGSLFTLTTADSTVAAVRRR